MSSSGKPYLSVVVPSRNDDHGGNTLRRMQVFFSGLLEQLEKHRIDAELVLVDWNPPAGRPLLRDAIKWPPGLKHCTIRNIVVPPEVHRKFDHGDKAPFHFAAANNCGIRRARGEYILPAGIDLLYSDDLMAFIAGRNLKSDERYRVSRYDVDRNVVRYDTLPEQLDFCRENVILVKAYKKKHAGKARNAFPELHTSACGDFQLMSRHYWHLLRGFREADIVDGHCDGVLSYASYAAGVKEVVLEEPLRLYHIDHDEKYTERTREARFPLENRLSFTSLPAPLNAWVRAAYHRLLTIFGYKTRTSTHGVPTLGFLEYRRLAKEMLRGKRSYICNDEDWGLGQEKLEEHVIHRADWDREYEAPDKGGREGADEPEKY
ncbi:MAG TPA: hypothetical protein VJ377_06700 [Dehalococcoidales bacterium]|nr:hypothetical protein [Dehalococcoidales bacterium]